MMLFLDTAYRSFGGEVEASSTPTICRLPDSRRHQLWAIAPGGTNEEIRFALGQTSLGAILVASSKKGVASILLGNDPDALLRQLQDRFPKAKLIGADKDYEGLVARVVGFIEAPKNGPTRRPPSAVRRFT